MKTKYVFLAFLLTVLVGFVFPGSIKADGVPISRNATVTVSQSAAGSNPVSVLDSDSSTSWNSGAYAPQWIQLDFGQAYTINHIRLKSGQVVDGRTVNTIYLGSTSSSLALYLTLDRVTKAGEWIDIPLLTPVSNIRYIKITSTISPSPISWKDIEVYDVSAPVAQHLNYFGYYGIISGVYPYDYYFFEIGPLQNSNVCIIVASDAAKMTDMLQQARKYHLQAFIFVRNVLYSDKSISPNYLAEIQKLVPVVHDNDDVVAGFYFDEIFASTGGNTTDFVTITKALHDTFPNKKILEVEAGGVINPALNPSANLPAIHSDFFTYVTDVGFDYYPTVWNGSNDKGWGLYLDTHTMLKALVAGKPIWVIPDGLSHDYAGTLRWPDIFARYMGLAMSDPQIIGILNFIWSSPDTYYTIVLRNVFSPTDPNYNPGFRANQIAIGKAITGHVNPPAPIPKPGDLNADSKVDNNDYTIFVSNFGKTGVAGFSPSDIDKNGKVDIFDYNVLVTNFGK